MDEIRQSSEEFLRGIEKEKQGRSNGIPDDMKERVFDMFYSGANTVADSRRSLGMGLSLCRSIVNAHGGKIEVSDNIPHGAVFTISLPAGEVQIHE